MSLALALLSAVFAFPVACDQGEQSSARTDSGEGSGNDEPASNGNGQSNGGEQSNGAGQSDDGATTSPGGASAMDDSQASNDADTSEAGDDGSADDDDADSDDAASDDSDDADSDDAANDDAANDDAANDDAANDDAANDDAASDDSDDAANDDAANDDAANDDAANDDAANDDAANDDAANDDATSDDAVSDDTADDDTASDDTADAQPRAEESRVGSPCPDAPPEAASACEAFGTYCSYDTLADPSCREAFTCTPNLVWAAIGIPGGSCFSPPPAACAAPVVHGDACEAGVADCSSGGASCRCAVSTPSCSPDGFCDETPPGDETWWQCVARNPECPGVPQNAGTVCEESTPSCLYGQPCGGLYVSCRDGIIRWEQDVCP